MASNALVPLVSFEKAKETVEKILHNISHFRDGKKQKINQNAIHGSLLQLAKLMSKWCALPLVKINVGPLFTCILRNALWVMETNVEVSPISKKVLLDILVMYLTSKHVEEGKIIPIFLLILTVEKVHFNND